MATLEDKILGEKAHNYCSSSEDEGGPSDNEDNNEEGNKAVAGGSNPEVQLSMDTTHWNGTSANTGPKGVIKDWQRFKQLETEKREAAEQEKLELMKKLSITGRSDKEEKRYKEVDDFDRELLELMNDEYLLEYQKKRMAEMLTYSGRLPTFGAIMHLTTADQLLDAIDGEETPVTIVLHIFNDRISACKNLNTCLDSLAKDYPYVKFLKIDCNTAGMSSKFKQHGLPALLIYKNRQVIGNFIRVSDELGDDFVVSDVESLLCEHALLPDKTCIPVLTASNPQDSDDD